MEDAVSEHGASSATVPPAPDWTAIGRRLREARERAGVSQRQLGPRLGVDRSTIQKAEVGRLIPSVELACRIEATLGCEPGAIFGAPRPCGRCGRPNFADYCQGHGPKHAGPVERRRDRPSRSPLGNQIRLARVTRGLTARELGALVAVTGDHVSSIENGHDLPSGALARRLADALELEVAIFDLQPCACGHCDQLTVGGGYAHGHEGLSADARAKVSAAKLGKPRPDVVERWRDWWADPENVAKHEAIAERWRLYWRTGGGPVRALFEKARENALPIPIHPATRQRIGQKWGGSTPPRPGARSRGRQVSDAVTAKLDDVLERRARGESIRQIALYTGLTKRQVEGILDRAGREEVSRKSSS